MPYVPVRVSDPDLKKILMDDCEKMIDGLLNDPNCGYAMSDSGEFLFIILRKPRN